MKNKITLMVIVVAIVAIASLIWTKSGSRPTFLEPKDSQNQDWKTYTNTGHGYKVSYPQDAIVAPVSEMEQKPLEQSEAITIEIAGVGIKFAVTAYLPYKNAPEPLAEEQSKLISLPLQEFVKTIRENQVNDPNLSVAGKEVGEIKKISFAGRKAYSFTLTKSFNKGLAGGFALPKNITFNFIFVENNEGIRLMIYYPLGDTISEKMKSSFEFTGE